MGLETFTFLSSLNSANPVGASDPKSQGDDHIRGIKAALLASFPNIAGAMTATHTELSLLAGKTGTVWTSNNDGTGSGLDADLLDGNDTAFFRDASNLNAGVLANARVQASNVTQHQAALALAATQITSGVLANAQVQQSNVTQHQAALSIGGSQITGSLANAQVQQSNVTQHQAALSIAISQLTGGPLAVASGGTSSTTASGARTALGLGTIATANVTAQSGGSPSGGADGDIFLIY